MRAAFHLRLPVDWVAVRIEGHRLPQAYCISRNFSLIRQVCRAPTTVSTVFSRSEFESLLSDSSDDELVFDQEPTTASSQRRAIGGAAAESRLLGREVSELEEPDEVGMVADKA